MFNSTITHFLGIKITFSISLNIIFKRLSIGVFISGKMKIKSILIVLRSGFYNTVFIKQYK